MMFPIPRPILPRLATRLALTIALACLPIGVLSYVQTTELEDEVRARMEEGLLGNTLRAAEAEISVIRQAQGIVAGLAQGAPHLIDDVDLCRSKMAMVAPQIPQARLVGFVPTDGILRCSTAPGEHDLSGNENSREIHRKQAPSFVVNPRGAVTQTSVLGVSHPVFDADGVYLGYTVIALPHAVMVGKAPLLPGDYGFGSEHSASQPLYMWSFDGDGTLLTASVDLDDARPRLPGTRPLESLVGQRAQVFHDVSGTGALRTYALVPIVEGKLYLMGMWAADATGLIDKFRQATYLSLLLMWLGGVLVAALAAERLVARHVRTLHHAIRAFARGDRRLEAIDLTQAPIELRELGESYLDMTESVTRGEAEMENIVHQKEVLLREIYHRVNNNLQLIASIMNLQMRKIENPEAKLLVRDLHDRIMSLATIHRGLYQTSGLTAVSTSELLADIVRQITAMAFDGAGSVKVQLDIDEMPMIPDQAVPLALFMTEALTRAIKNSAKPHDIVVRLKKKDDGGAVLSVVHTLPDVPVRPPAPWLGQQLFSAFTQQLRGRLLTEVNAGISTVAVCFPPAAIGPDTAADPARTMPAP